MPEPGKREQVKKEQAKRKQELDILVADMAQVPDTRNP
jgi:hypothetical protein